LLQQHGISYPTVTTDFCLPDGTGADNDSVLYYLHQNGISHAYAGYLDSAPLTNRYGVPMWSIGITSYNQIQTVWANVDSGGSQSLSYFESLVNRASSTFAVGITFHHINDHLPNGQVNDNISNLEDDLSYLNSTGFTIVTPPELPGYLTNYIAPPVPGYLLSPQQSQDNLNSMPISPKPSGAGIRETRIPTLQNPDLFTTQPQLSKQSNSMNNPDSQNPLIVFAPMIIAMPSGLILAKQIRKRKWRCGLLLRRLWRLRSTTIRRFWKLICRQV
jgi:hypothetical protein